VETVWISERNYLTGKASREPMTVIMDVLEIAPLEMCVWKIIDRYIPLPAP